MGRSETPLIFHSKILCLSLLYLLTTLPVSIYVSVSQTGCLFRGPPLLPQTQLFSYPSSYGEHKHALPTTRSKCNSPVHFSDYRAVFEEIRNLCRNSSSSAPSSPVLQYMRGRGGNFAGNFSTQNRKSFFNHTGDDQVEVPCGFLKEFLVKKSGELKPRLRRRIVINKQTRTKNDKAQLFLPCAPSTASLHRLCSFFFIIISMFLLNPNPNAVTAAPFVSYPNPLSLVIWRTYRSLSRFTALPTHSPTLLAPVLAP